MIKFLLGCPTSIIRLDERFVNANGIVSYTLSTGFFNSTTYTGNWADLDSLMNHIVTTNGGCWYVNTLPTDPSDLYYTNHNVRLTNITLTNGINYG